MEKILPDAEAIQNEDPRVLFDEYIWDNGIKQTWVADKLGMTKFTLNNILKMKKPLTESIRTQLNELLKTNY